MLWLTTRMRLRVGLVLAVVLAGVSALLALGGVINAVGGHQGPHAPSRLGQAILALIGAVLTVLSIRCAVRVEHRLHGLRPGSAVRHIGSPAPFWTVGTLNGRRQHHSPIAKAIVLVEFVGGFIALVIATFVLHADADYSQFVQQHGTLQAGTVVRVHNIAHHGKSSTWYTSEVQLSLDPPLQGRLDTTAHYPNWSSLPPGARVTVRVDSHDPGYAEFPGDPSTPDRVWIVTAVLAAVLGLIDALVLYQMVHLIRRRRQSLAGVESAETASPTQH